MSALLLSRQQRARLLAALASLAVVAFYASVAANISSNNFVVVEQEQHDNLVDQDHDVESETVRKVMLEQCGCYRKIRVNKDEESEKKQNNTLSTCSSSSFARGGGQKVVSFALYDSPTATKENKTRLKDAYLQGVLRNLASVRSLLGPDWLLRVYHDVDDDSALCGIACANAAVDLCHAADVPLLGDVRYVFPMVWRFLPGLDPQVSVFLSRDLDSDMSAREAAALREFLSSGAEVHVMRDHPAHTAPILGGMWGAKVDKLRPQMVEAFKDMHKSGLLRRTRRRKGTDQEALTRFFWPWARLKALAHDSYFCLNREYMTAKWRPFPTKREKGVGNFVGSVLMNNATLRLDPKWECPVECRPKRHKDWLHC